MIEYNLLDEKIFRELYEEALHRGAFYVDALEIQKKRQIERGSNS